MPYSPKYTTLLRVKSVIRPHADGMSENDLLDRIEEAERRVEDFLVSNGYNLESLSTVVQEAARDLSTYRTLEALAPSLPVERAFKKEVQDGFRALSEALEESLKKRELKRYIDVKAVRKEMEFPGEREVEP